MKLLNNANDGDVGDWVLSKGFQGMLVMYNQAGDFGGSQVIIEVSPDGGTTALNILDQAGAQINQFSVPGAISQFSIPQTIFVRAKIGGGGAGTGISVELR